MICTSLFFVLNDTGKKFSRLLTCPTCSNKNMNVLHFQLEFWFNQYTTTPTAVSAIQAVQYHSGTDTKTYRALKQIYERMIVPSVSGKFC